MKKLTLVILFCFLFFSCSNLTDNQDQTQSKQELNKPMQNTGGGSGGPMPPPPPPPGGN